MTGDPHQEIKTRLGRVLSILIKDYRPHKIILFGSWVNGDFREESDIDLLIIKPTSRNRLERAWEVYRLLSPGKNHPMDVIVLTPDEISDRLALSDPFINEVLKNGILLFEDGGESVARRGPAKP